jgi:putative hemolysin
MKKNFARPSLEGSGLERPRPGKGLDEGRGLRQSSYFVRFASSETDRLAAFRLRFAVFNLELNEGLESGYLRGQDSDEFDPICDHLIVEHTGTGPGRLHLPSPDRASGEDRAGILQRARARLHTLREPSGRNGRTGRACIHREHRSTEVLNLLWRGIAQYALGCGARYLVGYSSLTSQDPALGTAVYDMLRAYEAESALRTEPKPCFAMPLVRAADLSGKVPKLLRAYLAIAARICGTACARSGVQDHRLSYAA